MFTKFFESRSQRTAGQLENHGLAKTSGQVDECVLPLLNCPMLGSAEASRPGEYNTPSNQQQAMFNRYGAVNAESSDMISDDGHWW